MLDVNNFGRLIEIRGRNFDDLKAKLMEIPHPVKVIHKIDRMPTGQYYAILELDRPVSKKPKKAE